MDRADKLFLVGLLLANAVVVGVVVYLHPYQTWPEWWPWASAGYALAVGPLLAAAWVLGGPD